MHIRVHLILSMLGLAFLLSACRGCEDWAASSDPRDHIASTSAAVLELKDLRMLIFFRDFVREQFGHLVREDELSQLQAEITRKLGFDPFTREGLASAGIPAKGRVVLSNENNNPVLVFPVIDSQKAQKAVRSFAQNHLVDSKRTEKTLTLKSSSKSIQMDVFEQDTSSFNFEEEVSMEVVAAFVVYRGFGFCGLGIQAESTLIAAIERSKAEALSNSEKYMAFVRSEPEEDWLIRGVALHGDKLSKELRKRFGSTAYLPLVDEIESVGWRLGLVRNGLNLQAQAHWKGAFAEKIKQFAKGASPMVPAVTHIHVPHAVVHGEVNGDPKAIFEILMTPGIFGRRGMPRDLRMLDSSDAEKIFNGQIGISLGVKDLSTVSFEKLVMAPEDIVWSLLSVGIQGKEGEQKFLKLVRRGLERLRFAAKPVDISGRNGTQYERESSTSGHYAFVQVSQPDMVVYGNDKSFVERFLTSPSSTEASSGPGVRLVLYLERLAAQLKTFPTSQIPLLARGLVSQGLQTLQSFEQLEVLLTARDNKTFAEVTLVPAPPKKDVQ
ncbi:MAG: hypothetical protein KTR25_00410 [Myxococcales bacterium]|nr:hypothetical protein [Myxococcales bacterium]